VLVFGGLVRIDENLKFQGELAERWESSADLKTWTFYLRKGVKFHHGKRAGFGRRHRHLQADRRSQDRLQRAHRTWTWWSPLDAVDKYTVRFNLKIPYAGFAELMVERQLKIVPADRLDKLSTEPSGTGPSSSSPTRPATSWSW
jgi:peptide/nickel transport system substrate-binding protein